MRLSVAHQVCGGLAVGDDEDDGFGLRMPVHMPAGKEQRMLQVGSLHLSQSRPASSVGARTRAWDEKPMICTARGGAALATAVSDAFGFTGASSYLLVAGVPERGRGLSASPTCGWR